MIYKFSGHERFWDTLVRLLPEPGDFLGRPRLQRSTRTFLDAAAIRGVVHFEAETYFRIE